MKCFFKKNESVIQTFMTLFCRTDNILQNIRRIQIAFEK